MKAKSKKLAGILSMLFALLAFMPNTVKAQCNYSIVNALSCPVEIQVTITSPMNECPTCASIPSIIIPPGGTYPLNICALTCAPNPCNITVTVVNIGGTPVPTPLFADFTTGPPGNSTKPVSLNCSTSGSAFIFYNPATMMFGIHP